MTDERDMMFDMRTFCIVRYHGDRTIHFENGGSDFRNVVKTMFPNLLFQLFRAYLFVFEIRHDIATVSHEEPRLPGNELRKLRVAEQYPCQYYIDEDERG